MYKDYLRWLIEEKNIGQKSAHDYVSRLKRAVHLLNGQDINAETLDRLNTEDTFTKLSTSVKSQIKRAVKLYLEFLNE